MDSMNVRIAIPEPTSKDSAYNSRSLPQYIAALQSAGATALIIPIHERPDRVARLLAGAHGVLLPGSRFDVDPERYGEGREAACGEADPGRSAADELLLQDAFNLRKPVLAICQGIQSLNVWRNGTLIQDLPTQGYTVVNHTPGREVEEAHPVRIVSGTRLARMAPSISVPMLVNSSHHQALGVAGDNLLVTAVSPADGVIEAVELNSSDHFVLGVQWHPERTYTKSAFSRAIFAALVREAESWHPIAAQEQAVSA